MNVYAKQKQTYSYRKQTSGYQRGKVSGRDKLGIWDQHTHTTIYKIDNQEGPMVQHKELYSMLCNNQNLKKSGYMYMHN